MTRRYFSDWGGLPAQNSIIAGRAVFTEAYAVMPRHVQSDITASLLPGWEQARAWVLARPLSGFAETFAELIVELAPGGGSEAPEPDPEGEGVLFLLEGEVTLRVDGASHQMAPGGFAFLPPGSGWTLRAGDQRAVLVWIRKRYEPVPGIAAPEVIVTNDADITPMTMPNTDGRWSTTRFVDPADLRHDMHVTIVNLAPGADVPFTETHVMEHGLLVLQGQGVYRLNRDWVEVEAGDFMWLRAFCPQGCHASGSDPFRYLLYKDVNRHPRLAL
ncbi:bifunctional allantoicase/(S)-ureidoglycine aminohydrolase [Pseudooceanicola sp.]|uniref:bifunctional allantoicase/(S)-ureidoglycine aminohydrolase n=1 Tax=Pseudooceanicola sp. TaxID=1914328 RepID=UPI002630DC62|nr:bifunctional allantoicase/(S)-ureidoglycine aminohydrolase [Pseudooceanicola sp.]MDF1856059.1 bifunctional allantoicase/(S)-ureidoglycine aminohydrolase [Pseudooceanicola sp.]